MAESSDTRRNRVAAFFEILTRPATSAGEHPNALTALFRQDPSREFISEAIAYVRDPESVVSGGFRLRDNIDSIDRAVLLHKIEHLRGQLDFCEKHDARHVGPRLKQQADRLDYLESELGKARYKIRSYEGEIAALRGRLGDSEPSDLERDNDLLRRENAAFGLENTRLKANRSRKDKQIKEWRREIEFLHEYVALLKKDPAIKTPDRQWPPPSWCPTEETDPDAATVQELRAEIDRLQTENTYLKVERARSQSDQGSERPDPKRAAEPPTPEPINPKPITPEPAPQQPGRGRHFGAYPDPATMQNLRGLTTRLKLDNAGLLKTLIDKELADPPTVLPPRRKRANRIHHFGCYPDQEMWVKIRQLLSRYRIDNTELLSYLVEKTVVCR